MSGQKILVAALLFLSHLCVSPGRTPAEPLSLEEALQKALQKSPAVSAQKSLFEAALAREQAAFSGYLPSLRFTESYLRSDQPVASFGGLLNQGRFSAKDFALERLNDPESLENFQTRFSLHQPLFTGGETQNLHKAAKKDAQAARFDYEGALADVALETVRAYWGLSLARQSVGVAEMAVATAEESLRQIQALYKEGTVVRSDLLSAEVRLADFRESLVRARGRSQVAEAALGILLREKPSGSWEVVPLLPIEPPDMPVLDPAPLYDVARSKRPDHAALRARAEAAAAAEKAARAAFLPRLGLETSYEWNSPKFQEDQEGSYLLGVALEWSLFEGLRDRSRLREAAASAEAARQRLRAFQDRMRLEIQEVLTDVETQQESLAVTQERVSQAEENLRIVRQRYQGGLTTVVELQQAELTLSHSRLQRLQAAHDLRISLARLKWVTGELVPVLPSLSLPSGSPASSGSAEPPQDAPGRFSEAAVGP